MSSSRQVQKERNVVFGSDYKGILLIQSCSSHKRRCSRCCVCHVSIVGLAILQGTVDKQEIFDGSSHDVNANSGISTQKPQLRNLNWGISTGESQLGNLNSGISTQDEWREEQMWERRLRSKC